MFVILKTTKNKSQTRNMCSLKYTPDPSSGIQQQSEVNSQCDEMVR